MPFLRLRPEQGQAGKQAMQCLGKEARPQEQEPSLGEGTGEGDGSQGRGQQHPKARAWPISYSPSTLRCRCVQGAVVSTLNPTRAEPAPQGLAPPSCSQCGQLCSPPGRPQARAAPPSLVQLRILALHLGAGVESTQRLGFHFQCSFRRLTRTVQHLIRPAAWLA